jgi:hypothetical protein
MKRTTIFVPESLERDLQLYARRQNRSVAWVVREALAEYLVARRAKAGLPSFTGIGISGRSDIADRHEALLWPEPHGEPASTGRKKGTARRAARGRR